MKILPKYISQSWDARLRDVLKGMSDWTGGGFAAANAAYVGEIVQTTHDRAYLHVVFNLGSEALSAFTETDDYKNVYERPVVAGRPLAPSAKRQHVDELVLGANASDYYFCALSVNGVGMRFYGEYCVVLRSPDDENVEKVLDRNSYDLVADPLASVLTAAGSSNSQSIVDSLTTGFRGQNLATMLAIKVLQRCGSNPRRLTLGTLGQAILYDEDYAEAYHKGKIRLSCVLEVRSHPEDEMSEWSIEERFARGEGVSVEELLWVARRVYARRRMDRLGIRHRVVAGNGRGQRWK